jgi:recombination protein RecA
VTRDKPPSFKDALAEINKKYRFQAGSLSDVADEVTGLTTGSLAIDYLTGVGGIPRARITELYGQPSSGKTTTALQCAAILQSKIISGGSDDHILYLDFEHALDGDYCAALGLDVDHPSFVLVQPNWLEQGAEISEKLIKTGKVRLSIWDSVAEMTPEDVEFGVRTTAMERARLLKSLLQRHNSLFYENDCAGIFLNHMVEAVSMSGRPGMPPVETSPGGVALKFYSSLRLAFKQIGQKRGKAPDALTGEVTDQVIATYVKVKATKNKVGIPMREAELRVRFGQGFDEPWSALNVLLDHKRVTKSGAMYVFNPKNVPGLMHADMSLSATGLGQFRGEGAVFAFADSRPDWRDQLIKEARSTVEQFGAGSLATDRSDDELFAEEDSE